MRDDLMLASGCWTRRGTGVGFAGYAGVMMLAVGLAGCDDTTPTLEAPGLPGVAPASMADGFQVDPFWPKPLPEGWLLGNVVGVATDSGDNVWIIHRPGSQAGAGETPPVIAFDPAGNVVQSWGAPGDGYDWGTQTHGIHVDHQDNVWVGFGGGLPYDPTSPTTTDNALVLKFTLAGEFLLQIGDFGRGTEGSSSTEFLGQPTDIFVDPQTDEVYISDGYTNRRVIVFDANTGEHKRLWGAYGNAPDDGPMPRFSRDSELPPQFSTPHCVAGAADGLVYVCDRGNQRIQVFSTGWYVRGRAADRSAPRRRAGWGHPVGPGVLTRSRTALPVCGRWRRSRGPHARARLARGRRVVRPAWALGRSVRVAAQSGTRLAGQSVRRRGRWTAAGCRSSSRNSQGLCP